MIYRNAGAEYMATINTAFPCLFINGVSHTKKVSTDASTLEGLSVCGAAHGNRGGGHMDAALTHPVLFILLSEFRINMCLCPLDEKNRKYV